MTISIPYRRILRSTLQSNALILGISIALGIVVIGLNHVMEDTLVPIEEIGEAAFIPSILAILPFLFEVYTIYADDYALKV